MATGRSKRLSELLLDIVNDAVGLTDSYRVWDDS